MNNVIGYVDFFNSAGLEITAIGDTEVEVVPVSGDWRGGHEKCPIYDEGNGFFFGKLFISFDECMMV